MNNISFIKLWILIIYFLLYVYVCTHIILHEIMSQPIDDG